MTSHQPGWAEVQLSQVGPPCHRPTAGSGMQETAHLHLGAGCDQGRVHPHEPVILFTKLDQVACFVLGALFLLS